MNKRYLLLFGGTVAVIIIFASFLFFQQEQNVSQPSVIHNQSPVNESTTMQQNSALPTIKLPPLANSPKEATRQFYTYYFSTPSNPLANGAYKNNPYLSDEFKQVISGAYNNGNSPIFCPQNKRAAVDITVGKEVQVYWNNQYLTKETISDISSGKDLYTLTLKNQDGKWLVFDADCAY